MIREKRRSISFSEDTTVMKYEYCPSSRAGQLSHRRSVMMGDGDGDDDDDDDDDEGESSKGTSKVDSGQQSTPMTETKLEEKAPEAEDEQDGRRVLVKGLFSKARHNKTEDAEAILDKGISIDTRDSFGNTILIIAAQNGHKAMMKLCLRKRADINSQNVRSLHSECMVLYHSSHQIFLISERTHHACNHHRKRGKRHCTLRSHMGTLILGNGF
jgi:ankyrin repeat protein